MKTRAFIFALSMAVLPALGARASERRDRMMSAAIDPRTVAMGDSCS